MYFLKNSMRLLLMCIFMNASLLFGGMFGQPGGMFGQQANPMAGYSPEQQRQMEAELEQALAQMTPEELEQVLISNMNPQEKDKYYKTKENLEKMPIEDVQRFVEGKMDESEMEQFVKQATVGISEEEETAAQEMPQASEPTPVEEQVSIDEEKKLASQQEKVIDLLNAIIKKSDAFLVKVTSAIPDIESRFKGWMRKGYLREVSTDMTWRKMKEDIDGLMQKLRKLMSRDDATNKYRYLPELLKDTALQTNLERLRDTLNSFEPKVMPPNLSAQKVSKQTRQAIQALIDRFAEAFTKMKINDALDAIFEKFEPEAKKRREMREQEKQRAQTEGRRPQMPGRSVVGGTGEDDYGFVASAPYGGNSGGGSSPYSYGGTGTYGAPSYARPSFGGPSDFTAPVSAPTAASRPMGGVPTAGGPAMPSAGAPSTAGAVPGRSSIGASTAPSSGPSPAPLAAPSTRFAGGGAPSIGAPTGEIGKLADRIITNLGDLHQAIISKTTDDNDLLNIRKHLVSNKSVDTGLYEQMNQAIAEAKKATTLVNQLAAKGAPAAQYAVSVSGTYDGQKNDYEGLTKGIARFMSNWKNNQLGTPVAATKQYLFLGDRAAQGADVDTIRTQFSAPQTIDGLAQALKDLQDAIKKLPKSNSGQQMQSQGAFGA